MPRPPATSDTHGFRRAVAAALVLLGLQVLLLVVHPWGEEARRWAVALLAVLGALASAASCARPEGESRVQMRRSGKLFAAACASWAIGKVLALGLGHAAATAGAHRLGGLASGGFITFAVAAMAMLWTLPAGSAARARGLLDAFIVAVALMSVAWTATLAGESARFVGTGYERFLHFLLPMGDVVLSTFLVSVFLSGRPRARLSSRVVAMTATGLLLFVVVDAATYVTQHVSDAGGVLEVLRTAALLCIGVAARWPDRAKPRRGVPEHRVLIGQVVPSAVAASILTLVLARVNRTGTLDLMLEWLASCLVVCVLVRQLVTVVEEHRLKSLLEARVADRTAQLSRREEQFTALVQHSSDVIVIIRGDGRFDYVSPSVEHVLGHTPAALTEGSISQIVLPEDRPRVMALLAMATRRSGATMNAEWRVLRADGELRQVEVLVRNLVDEPAVGGIVLNLRDVTERKELEDQLTHQALHDELTGLANRSLLRLRIEQALARWLFQNEPFTLVVVDVDDFRAINDSLGHVAGDAVLRTMAERIGPCTRRGDAIVRVDGDEFAVLLEGVAADDPEAHHVAQRLIESLGAPMRVEGRKIALRVSIGLACVTDQVSQADDIVRNADLALHHAKVANRGGYVPFELAMHDQALRRVEMEADLRRALERGELDLYYQPTFDIPTGQMEGVEALLRWPHPEKGSISPAEFVPLAEDSGLIVPIGSWVLRRACEDVRRWQLAHPDLPPLLLNVNLSGRQLDQPDIVEVVAAVLDETGLPASTLVLEMTESVLMDDNPRTLAKMQSLVALGCQLAIDDFGTGYSSLSYLRKFPIGVLKVDRSFVRDVGERASDDAALVRAIIDLARTLRMRTVAEGIETVEQLAELRRMGCDVGQGFLLGKPVPLPEVEALIAATYAVGVSLEDHQQLR